MNETSEEWEMKLWLLKGSVVIAITATVIEGITALTWLFWMNRLTAWLLCVSTFVWIVWLMITIAFIRDTKKQVKEAKGRLNIK